MKKNGMEWKVKELNEEEQKWNEKDWNVIWVIVINEVTNIVIHVIW